MKKIAPYWKALIAFVTPGLLLIGSAVLESSAGGESITTGEAITALVTMVVTSGGVLAKGNKDPERKHQDESVQPPSA